MNSAHINIYCSGSSLAGSTLLKQWDLSPAGCGWSHIRRVIPSLPLPVFWSEGNAEPDCVVAELCPSQHSYHFYFYFIGVLSCSLSPWPAPCWDLGFWALPTKFTDRKHWDRETLRWKVVSRALKPTVTLGPSPLREHYSVLKLEIGELVFTAVSDSAIRGPQEQKHTRKDKSPLPEHILDEVIMAWKIHCSFTRAVFPLTQRLSFLADTESSLGRLARSCAYEGEENADSLVLPTLCPWLFTLWPPQQAEHLPVGRGDHSPQLLSSWLERGDCLLLGLERAPRGLPRFPVRCRTKPWPTYAHLHLPNCKMGGGVFTHLICCLFLSQRWLGSALMKGSSKYQALSFPLTMPILATYPQRILSGVYYCSAFMYP